MVLVLIKYFKSKPLNFVKIIDVFRLAFLKIKMLKTNNIFMCSWLYTGRSQKCTSVQKCPRGQNCTSAQKCTKIKLHGDKTARGHKNARR